MICKICQHEFDEGITPKNKVICPQCGAYANDKQNVLLDILCFFLNIFAWIPYLILRKKHPKIARGCVLWGAISLLLSFFANFANPYNSFLGELSIIAIMMIYFHLYLTWQAPLVKKNSDSVVKCTNKLCGKEISCQFDKCPFCGTPVIKPENETNKENENS